MLAILLYGQELPFIAPGDPTDAARCTVHCGSFSRHLRISISRFKDQLLWLQEYGFVTNLNIGRSMASFTLVRPPPQAQAEGEVQP